MVIIHYGMTEVLKRLDLDSPNKVVIYISGILFILSFFFVPLDIASYKMRYKSLVFLLAGLILWAIQLYIGYDVETEVRQLESDKYETYEIKEIIRPKVRLWYILVVVIYLISAILAFSI